MGASGVVDSERMANISIEFETPVGRLKYFATFLSHILLTKTLPSHSPLGGAWGDIWRPTRTANESFQSQALPEIHMVKPTIRYPKFS
jgi:hypothetical protein